jgi:hypothetical protein
MDAPRRINGQRVIFYAAIPPETREREYTYPEFTHPTESGRLIVVHSLALVEWDGAFMLYELDADGHPLDDTWFETAEEAFGTYNDVDWREVTSA